MSKNANVKNRIIEVTTELIEQYNGNTKDITARMIAEKADIGLGLINYHFRSKEKLIMERVQQIIGQVVAGFHIEQKFQTDKERLTAWGQIAPERFLLTSDVLLHCSKALIL